jgi:hypothetical protein
MYNGPPLHTLTHSPQTVQRSWSMITSALPLARLVGTVMIISC